MARATGARAIRPSRATGATRSSIVMESAGGRMLVDTGPDMRAQLLACAVPRDRCVDLHPCACRPHDRAGRCAPAEPHRRRAAAGLCDRGTTLAELARRFDYAFKPWTPPHFYRPVLEVSRSSPATRSGPRAWRSGPSTRTTTSCARSGCALGGSATSTDVVRLDDAAFETLAGIDTWVVGCFQRQPHLTHAACGAGAGMARAAAAASDRS